MSGRDLRSERDFDDQVFPVVRSIICPESESERQPLPGSARSAELQAARPGLVPPNAYENSGLRRREAQNCPIIKVVQTGGLGGLKIDAQFTPQGCVDNDALQVVVRLKTDAQCFARS